MVADGEDTNVAIIPAYNEEEHIVDVIRNIGETGIIDDIIVIDDYSTDDTVGKVEQTDAVLISNPKNLHKGGALKRGYSRALEMTPDYIFRLDGDGQHDPGKLVQFYSQLKQAQTDYVVGNRFADREDIAQMPLDRRFGNRMVAYVTSLRLGQLIHDPTCGYRGMSASLLARTPFEEYSNDYRFGVEELFAFKYLRAEIREIPITCIYGKEESTLNHVDGLKYLLPSLFWRNGSKNFETDGTRASNEI